MSKFSLPRAGAVCALGLALAAAAAVHPAFQARAYAVREEQAGAVQAAVSSAPAAPEPAPQQPAAVPSSPSPAVVYLRDAPKLAAHGYSQAEIDQIFSNLGSVSVQPLLDHPYDARAVRYVSLPYFRAELLERCLDYGQANPELSAETVVTYVNIGLDQPFYSAYDEVQDPNATDVLVNKFHVLSSDFEPELVKMAPQYAGFSNARMEPTAYEHFTQMVDAAKADGLRLYAVSVYRSYSYQKSLYQSYVSRNGRASADTYSARAGFSEHQTGLAADINVSRISAHFERTAQYRWLTTHCWEYGFILRYPEGKKAITGFTFEPWHYRYVGLELAKEITESGLTYDEYMATRPTGEVKGARSLSVEGQTKQLQRAPLRLDGTYFLSASDLAGALGMTCTRTEDGGAVLAASGGSTLALTPRQARCVLDGEDQVLGCACFLQGQDLMVPLEDAANLLGYTVTEADLTLCLAPAVQA